MKNQNQNQSGRTRLGWRESVLVFVVSFQEPVDVGVLITKSNLIFILN
jgi:hypothetical protein